ncbi:heterogeneous nuclear ribonucleoprotein A/B-like [Mercenaria mercenaria]|uniref:heterogeneous nuclear ribonucleoprotein A/B-like n=1 Tax=Mercenaria mercenaria TaxID=6596 RepID=UPI00234F622A|nr:heterogeneous nuclear ribonucleoprotein A/B-like [Mercenaria mercenaria]
MASFRRIQRLRKLNKNSIFINGLNWKTGTQEMRNYFDDFGKVADTFIFMDAYRGISKGQAIVQFRDKEAVDSVFKQSHHYIDGQEVTVQINKGNRFDSQQNDTDQATT